MKTKKEKIQVPQSRLDELVAEVTGELQTVLKSEAEALAKADGDDDADDHEPDASAPAEESSGSAAGAPSDGPPAPEASAPAAPEASAPAAPEASAPAPDAAMAPDASASAAPTLDDLVGAYSQLPPEELDLHLQAATIAKQASASAAGAAPEASAPAAPPMAPAPEASAPPMGKAEGVPSAQQVAKSPGSGGMKKSEPNPEIELLKQQNELLKSENAKFEKSLTELVSALHEKMPLRKSAARISDVEYQGKPGEKKPAGTEVDVTALSKAEVTKRLRQAARNPSLSKADRGLINGFCSGSVKLDAIGHLLTSAK